MCLRIYGIGAFWGAALFGVLIEGIPVAVLYQSLPFSILWTSLDI
jgi:hypothetical protein